MTTPRDILRQAFKDITVLGVGQTLLPEDYNDAFSTLNQLLSEWRRKRWMVYRLVDTGFTSTGAVSYTVGPGGNYNLTARPDRLEAAFLRQLVPAAPNQVDYPMDLIQSMEDYARISLKQLGSFPQAVFYDPQYPLGVLYPWPVPQASLYQVHILTKMVLEHFTSLTETIILPPEYESALRYNIAIRLAVGYESAQVTPQIIALAKSTLATVIGANTAIATLQMPSDLVRGGIYNIFADRYY
jgi:hypothetical protein